MAWRIDSTEVPTVSVQDTTVTLCFNNLLTVKVTKSQAWALQDALRKLLSPSAANHKCPECGGLGAPSHPCPKTGLTCSCCFECTEKCEARKPVDLVEACEPDMWAALEEAKQEEVSGFGVGRLEPVDTRKLEAEVSKFTVPREKL